MSSVEGTSRHRLLQGLDGFAEQFVAQVGMAGAPPSEHAVHFCLALGFQTRLNLGPGHIVFERPVNDSKQRTDIWVGPQPGTAIEVKYNRPIPSGNNRPFTQLYGSLLADFNKLSKTGDAADRLVILVADPPSSSHMEKAGHGLLPTAIGAKATLSGIAVAKLPPSAQQTALSHGDWSTDMTVELIWKVSSDGWVLKAWSL